MDDHPLIIHADAIEPCTFPRLREVCHSQCVIDPDGVGSRRLVVNRFTRRAGHALKGVAHPPGHDECYYMLCSRATVILGISADGAATTRHEIGPNMAVFNPGGAFHGLDNPNSVDLEVLTIWPSVPEAGAQPFWDGRRQAWGTTYLRRTTD